MSNYLANVMYDVRDELLLSDVLLTSDCYATPCSMRHC